jgi:REP element-mobilizing transposase RayT
MPRSTRDEVEGGVHHVFARGNDRREIYLDDFDRKIYLVMLGRVTRRQRWRCLAYCLMPNHVHLLVETPEANLGAGMQRLHGSYAQTFNERHGRSGHVFQGRYGSVLITRDEQLWTVARPTSPSIQSGPGCVSVPSTGSGAVTPQRSAAGPGPDGSTSLACCGTSRGSAVMLGGNTRP